MKHIMMILALVCAVGSAGFADIPDRVADRRYTPTFEEWLQVYLSTFNTTGEGYFLDVIVMPTDQDEVRIILMGYANVSEYAASDWYRNSLPTILKAIQLQCETFTAKGYPVDYVRDVHSMIHVRGDLAKGAAGPAYSQVEGQ